MPLNGHGHAHDHDDATRIVDAARSAWQDHDPLPPRVQPLDLPAWHASRYAGPPPRIDWIVDHLIPAGCAGLLAGAGGVGKSLLALSLALAVARGRGSFLGRAVTCGPRAAVVISLEDGSAAIHRRLHALDPSGSYADLPLYVVAAPDLPARWTLATQLPIGVDDAGAQLLLDELHALQRSCAYPIGLVVIDPLQSAVQGDLTYAPDVAYAACTALARIAAQTSAAVLATHHLRKGDAATTADDARAAIRGTTALVDAVRYAIALWPASDDTVQLATQRLRRQVDRRDLMHAAVVKANDPCDTTTRTLCRDQRGVLVDVTDDLADTAPTPAELTQLADAIAAAAAAGAPYRRRLRSEAGLWERRHELPEPLRSWTYRQLERALDEAIERGIVTVATKRGGQWLDAARR